MSRYRCNACAGEYDDVQADGTLYAHVCPEQRVVDSTPEELLAGKPAVQLVAIANRRDETLRVIRDRHPERPGKVLGVELRAEGAGRTDVTKAEG